MKYYLGVDCGGTKSLFMLSDENGRLLATYRTGSGSFFAHGAEGIRRLVEQGTAEVCRQAGISAQDIACAGLGFPGYGEGENTAQDILKACESVLGEGKAVCDCDCALGWAGALAMEPGVNIVAGTGSIVYGVDEQGRSARASGWGRPGDEGSCRWIGEKLIQFYTKQADGRMERTMLYDAFRAHFGIEDDLMFIYPTLHELMGSASETAKLQMLVQELERQGEPWAKRIYEEAAQELAAGAGAVAQKLGLALGYPVSYSGGLFRSGDSILKPLEREVRQNGGILIPPHFTPEQGAVLMAMRRDEPGRSFEQMRFEAVEG